MCLFNMFLIELFGVFSFCLFGYLGFFVGCILLCLFCFVLNVLKLVEIFEFVCLCKVNRFSGVYEVIVMNIDFFFWIELYGFKINDIKNNLYD